MITYVLTFVACLASGQDCREVVLPWNSGLMQCMLFNQQLVAEWERDNPGRVAVKGDRRRPIRCTSTTPT